MKKLCALLFSTTFFAVSTHATQNPYTSVVQAHVAHAISSLSSHDLENILDAMDGLYSQKPDAAPKAVDSPESEALMSVVNDIYQEILKAHAQRNEKESEEELLAQEMILANLVLLSVYRLMYEQAEQRGLPIIARIISPDAIETITIENC
jgi:hypothetical protein